MISAILLAAGQSKRLKGENKLITKDEYFTNSFGIKMRREKGKK